MMQTRPLSVETTETTNNMIKPRTIPHTRRQRVVATSGVHLERSYVFLPAKTWEALERLVKAQHRSGSQIIENLISLASSGNQVTENTNDSSTTACKTRT